MKGSLNIYSLCEAYDVEAKLAVGKDGKGEIPKSLWETYSAMANTEGGVILLGVEELPNGKFKAHNIENTAQVLKDFWSTINNQQKVNRNILSDKDVSICSVSGDVNIIQIKVPRATRQQRPVYIGQNVFSGTYQRNNDGDFHCSDDVIKMMLAEQGSDTRDAVVCKNYGMQDVDMPTFQVYRRLFQNVNPDHVFNTFDDIEFLRQLGGWRKDRDSGNEGLTIAGLLMFGKLRSILDNLPNYILDYQEWSNGSVENRWIDRVTTDGKWAGNLFSFYQIVIKKLFADLKIPFALEGSNIRIDDTPVHKALREAFVNTLIHADYNGRVSVLVGKGVDLFQFRNPGLLRLPKSEVFQGGTSDCRNRNLQKMFQLVGFAEQAGSGFPKIRYGWDTQDWKMPDLEEKFDTNQTLLTLRMTNLLPEDAVAEARKELGVQFEKLSKTARLVVVTAYSEGCVNHERIKGLSDEHSSDISEILQKLVKKGFLEHSGKGRGTIYYPIGRYPTRNSEGTNVATSGSNVATSGSNVVTSGSNVVTSPSNVVSSTRFTPEDLNGILGDFKNSKRIPHEKMVELILKLCEKDYLTIEEIELYLARDAKGLGDRYINKLVASKKLERKYPTKNHPDQRYKTANMQGITT